MIRAVILGDHMRHVLIGALGLAALSSPAGAAVTFNQARVISNASANTDQADPSTSANGFGTQTRVLTAPGEALASASAQADSYDADGLADATASTLEQSRASFTDAASGFIDLAGVTSATTSDAASTAEAYSEGQAGTYTFTVDTASLFTVSYDYSESFTSPYFYNSVYVGAADFSSTEYSSSNQGENTSGVIKVALAPGTYLFDAYTQIGDDAFAAGGASTFGEHEELYNINISAAPEPSTWALMLLGVGGIGLAFRQAKRRHGFRFRDALAG